jgi:hypothetical protein
MSFVASYAKERNLTEAFVLTEAENIAANGLYQRTGATREEEPSAMYLYGGSAS